MSRRSGWPLLTGATLGALAVTTLASAPQQGRDVRPTAIVGRFHRRGARRPSGHRPEARGSDAARRQQDPRDQDAAVTSRSPRAWWARSAARPPGAAPAGEPVTPAFATNIATVADAPRSIVLMVDDESIPPNQEKKLQESLNNFLRDLPPTDQVALATRPAWGHQGWFHDGPRSPAARDRQHQPDPADQSAAVSDAHDAGDH